MDILIDDDKCASISSLKKLAHFVPEHAKVKTFEQVKAYIQDSLVQSGNPRLSCCHVEGDKDVYGVYLDNKDVMIMVVNV